MILPSEQANHLYLLLEHFLGRQIEESDTLEIDLSVTITGAELDLRLSGQSNEIWIEVLNYEMHKVLPSVVGEPPTKSI